MFNTVNIVTPLTMIRLSPLQWFRNVSISRKLYFVVGIMAMLIALELFTLWFSIGALSSLRAYVEGEGLWSKGQKDAVYNLQKYGRTYNETDYRAFLNFMKVPLGDHKTREELLKKDPDMAIARMGFIEGRNHPDDVDGMIHLFRRFHNVYYINKAISIWGEADPLITALIPLAKQLHDEINSGHPSQQKIEDELKQIEVTNEKLTVLEDNFSYTLGEGSRWLENLVLKLLFAVALTVEISGLLLTISVSRTIQRGLNEIIRVSNNISKGDFSTRASAFSGDELGTVANSFNQMTDYLEKSIAENEKHSEDLLDYSKKLEYYNSNLEQFAYVASHDLQEPLRTITNFLNLLEERQKDKLDPDSRRYLNHVVIAATRLKALVQDLLHFSRIGKQHIIETVDCDKVVRDVLSDMNLVISESGAKVQIGKLPVIKTSKTELHQLFQNLIGNAIQYRKPDTQPEIDIEAVKQPGNGWLFSVRDNGIGIDEVYKDKIFVIFQRLHNQKEYSGTGIGLSTCKKIVELNGGSIWVKSKPGAGSTFYFTYPKSVDV